MNFSAVSYDFTEGGGRIFDFTVDFCMGLTAVALHVIMENRKCGELKDLALDLTAWNQESRESLS